MNNILNKIINFIKNKENMYNIIILCIIFLLCYIIKTLFPINNNYTKHNTENNQHILTSEDEVSSAYETLSLPDLDETNTESSSFYDNINIRTNNKLYTQNDKKNDVLLDLYNDIYEDVSYYNLSDLNQDNLIKKEKSIFGGNTTDDKKIKKMLKNVGVNEPKNKKDSAGDDDGVDYDDSADDDDDDKSDFASDNQKIEIAKDYSVLEKKHDSMKMNSNSASKMDEENSSVFKNFKKDNIIKINNNIGIITNIDKKNVLMYYKIIKNADINDSSEEFSMDSSQLDNINIIADKFQDYIVYLNNNKLINDNSVMLTKEWILFLNDKKWFPIKFNEEFTTNNKLSDIYEYIFNNIDIYTDLDIDNINLLNNTFTTKYTEKAVIINDININKNNLPKDMISNMRKNIKLELLNTIPIKNFKNLKLINLVQENTYNYERYLIDYYNIYIIISNYKLNNIKLNKDICRNLLEDYKKQCDDTSLVHFDDCGKEQLKRAREKRDHLNTQIELLEEKQL
jgi:hypothetical protein